MTGPPSNEQSPRPAWLFVLPWSLDTIGGVSEVVRNLIIEAHAGGTFEPKLLVLDWSAQRVTETDDGRCRTFGLRLRLPGTPLRLHVGANAAWFAHAVPTLLRLRRWLREQRVSVVNIHYVGLSAFYFAVARRLGWIDCLMLSLHGADVQRMQPTGHFETILWRFVIGAADSVVACSHSFAATAEATIPLLTNRIAVVQNGIDASRSEEELRGVAPARTDDAPTLLCVATLEYKKGIDVLVRAFAEIGARHRAMRLVVVGRSSSYRDVLDALVAQVAADDPQIGARIEVVGGEPHEAVLRRMRDAFVFVLPSRTEPFGIVLLEAGLLGTPVVASAVGGIPEIVQDGVSGLLFRSEDVGQLVAAVDRLVAEPALRRTLAAAMRRRVLDDFAWSVSWRRYVMLSAAAARGAPVRPGGDAPRAEAAALGAPVRTH